MKRFLQWFSEWLMRKSKTPWARFITTGIDEEGQVRFDMAWNKAFIKNINEQGFIGESDEDSIQHFLMSSLMIPTQLLNEIEDEITSEEHPHLQSEKHTFKR